MKSRKIEQDKCEKLLKLLNKSGIKKSAIHRDKH